MAKCDGCGKTETQLGVGRLMQRCVGCYQASYCDGECQKAHRAAHRAFCKARAAEMAAVLAAPPTCTEEGLEDLPDVATLRRAAATGDAGAMTDLGICYEFGKGGVGVDLSEGVRWYMRAIASADPPVEAFHNLASCYHFGHGVQKNLPEAARLFRVAAERGDTESQYKLGCCLQRGEGVHYGPVEAFMWLKRAADAGYSEAQCEAGLALLQGRGADEDKPAGVVYFRRAADKGHVQSMYNLGGCFFNGDGVPRDVGQAVVWFQRARVAGHPEAGATLSRISAPLSPAQRSMLGL